MTPSPLIDIFLCLNIEDSKADKSHPCLIILLFQDPVPDGGQDGSIPEAQYMSLVILHYGK